MMDTKKESAEGMFCARMELFAAAVLSLWIVFLHGLFLFNAGPLWRDEVETIDLATMPTLGDLWHNLQFSNFPPLFLVVVRAWSLAGLADDFSYRLLGVVVGLSMLGVLWHSARAFGSRAPLLALALYAANPLALRTGDSMRAYGLGIAFTVLALARIWKFIDDPRLGNWLWAALAAVLSVQCMYQSAFFVAAFSVGALAVTLRRRQWKIAWQMLAIGAVAAASLLPYWEKIKTGREWLQIEVRRIQWDGVWANLSDAFNEAGGWMVGVWCGLAVVALVVAARRAMQASGWNKVYCGVAMLCGAVFHILFLKTLGLMQPWHFLILLAPSAVCMETILAETQPAWRLLARAGLALALLLTTARSTCEEAQWRQSNVDLVAGALKQLAQPQDMILVSPWFYAISLQRYYGTIGLATTPTMEDIRIHRYDLMKKRMDAEKPIADLLTQSSGALRSGHALWVVGDPQFVSTNRVPVFPPYHGGMNKAEALYCSSWVYQISQLVQTHATNASWAQIPVPGHATVNPNEDTLLFVYRGWKP